MARRRPLNNDYQNIQMTKEQVISVLQASLPKAVKKDEQMLAKHRRDVATARTKLEKEAKRVLALSDEQLQEHGFKIELTQKRHSWEETLTLECPASIAGDFEQAIAVVELSNQTKYVLSNSSNSWLFQLVTMFNVPKRHWVC